MTTDPSTAIDRIHLVQTEYLEMPGLQLTRPQVRRLWGLDDRACDEVLEELVASHFLRLISGDLYARDAPSR